MIRKCLVDLRCGLDIVLFMQKGSVKAFFPFHDNERRKKLFAKWVKRYANPANQPLDEIKVRALSFAEAGRLCGFSRCILSSIHPRGFMAGWDRVGGGEMENDGLDRS